MKEELNIKNYELVGIIKTEGEFTNEAGQSFPYKKYKIKFKNVNSPLVMEATVDRVFKDYVENDEY